MGHSKLEALTNREVMALYERVFSNDQKNIQKLTAEILLT